MLQKKNLRFRIFHDSHQQYPFSRIELGKSVFLIDTNAIYLRKQNYGKWRIRKDKTTQCGYHTDLNVYSAFNFKGKKLSISYSIKRGGGPSGEHSKLNALYGSEIIGDLQVYRGTIGSGTNGNRWPYLEGEDWKLVFHYEPASEISTGIFSIDYFEKFIETKSFSTGESASYIHDKIISHGFEHIKKDISAVVPVTVWELLLEGEGMPGGILRCLRYPGYQRYKTKIYGKYTVEEWLAMVNPFTASSNQLDCLEMLEWETPEKTQRGYLWSPIEVVIMRE